MLVAAWLLHGCGEASTDDDTGASSASSGAPTSTTEATSPGTTLDDASSSNASTTAADSTSTPASTGPGEGSTDAASSDDGDTASACDPPPPAGDACLECAAANCCTTWATCQADEPCACVVDCHVVQGGSLGMCSNQCNLDSDLYQALYFCGQASCLGTCEWDCC